MRKYFVGIFALGLLSAVLAVYVLVQGASGKQDNRAKQSPRLARGSGRKKHPGYH